MYTLHVRLGRQCWEMVAECMAWWITFVCIFLVYVSSIHCRIDGCSGTTTRSVTLPSLGKKISRISTHSIQWKTFGGMSVIEALRRLLALTECVWFGDLMLVCTTTFCRPRSSRLAATITCLRRGFDQCGKIRPMPKVASGFSPILAREKRD